MQNGSGIRARIGESDSERSEFTILAKQHESKSEAIAKSGFTPAVVNLVLKTGTHDSRCPGKSVRVAKSRFTPSVVNLVFKT